MKDLKLITQGKAVGVRAFLQKPVSQADLLDTLYLIGQVSATQETEFRELYAKPFARALQQGVSGLLNMEGEPEIAPYESRTLDVSGAAVIIGITGYTTGRVILYAEESVVQLFAMHMLGYSTVEELTENEAADAVEEAANIIAGRAVSKINNVLDGKELRLTPPGTISGAQVHIVSPRMTTFCISMKLPIGTVRINVGFAEGELSMDAKLINPFVDAFTTVMPMLGFPEPTRTKLYAAKSRVKSLGVSMLVGFTKQIRGNVVYNMSEESAKFIASQMMMGMPVETFDEMAQSAISELSNMLTAHTATNITALELDVDISTPSLTVGADFEVKVCDGQYLVVAMDLSGKLVELDIAVDQV